MTEREELRLRIMEAAAVILVDNAYADVTFSSIAEHAGMGPEALAAVFPSMRDIASAILDEEGRSMRQAQRDSASLANEYPLDALRATFHAVGLNIETQPMVRAGIRIAAESHEMFPERRIDPYRTWGEFVTGQLVSAEERGMLKPGVDITAISWILVSAGMGTKELMRFQNTLDQISKRLDATVDCVLALISNESAC